MGKKFRLEKDTMGEIKIDGDALWGAQTQRAYENFQISGLTFPHEFLEALGLIKYCATKANIELGFIDKSIGDFILQACKEVIAGDLNRHFPLDIFQTGSGTSTNMNANEVIANRAIQMMGGQIGSRNPIHPNDHVNMSQSSNDDIPSAIHIAAALSIRRNLIPSLQVLKESLIRKSSEFDDIIKTGRTHLQDATPVRLGQEFQGYATQINKAIDRILTVMQEIFELPLGGTAVGTGINRSEKFPSAAIRWLNQMTGEKFIEAEDHMEANATRDSCVNLSGTLKTIAVSMAKIADDIRWMGSGPRNGLGELRIPAIQPGSSIMPGKINPVIPEAVLMCSAQVIANDLTVTQCGLSSHFELNLMMPLLAYHLLQSIRLLSSGARSFALKCIDGLEADRDRCNEGVERNLALATALTPIIGYDKAAAVSKEAYRTGKTVREIVLEWKLIDADELKSILQVRRMTVPGTESGTM
jgi:fumarate hydratase, class II